jgi:hypothetical protein
MFSGPAVEALAFSRGGLELPHCAAHARGGIRRVLELAGPAFKTKHEAHFILVLAGVAFFARVTSDFFLVFPLWTFVARRLRLDRVEFPRNAGEAIWLARLFLVIPDGTRIASFFSRGGLEKARIAVFAHDLVGGNVGRLARGTKLTCYAPFDRKLTFFAFQAIALVKTASLLKKSVWRTCIAGQLLRCLLKVAHGTVCARDALQVVVGTLCARFAVSTTVVTSAVAVCVCRNNLPL